MKRLRTSAIVVGMLGMIATPLLAAVPVSACTPLTDLDATSVWQTTHPISGNTILKVSVRLNADPNCAGNNPPSAYSIYFCGLTPGGGGNCWNPGNHVTPAVQGTSVTHSVDTGGSTWYSCVQAKVDWTANAQGGGNWDQLEVTYLNNYQQTNYHFLQATAGGHYTDSFQVFNPFSTTATYTISNDASGGWSASQSTSTLVVLAGEWEEFDVTVDAPNPLSGYPVITWTATPDLGSGEWVDFSMIEFTA